MNSTQRCRFFLFNPRSRDSFTTYRRFFFANHSESGNLKRVGFLSHGNFHAVENELSSQVEEVIYAHAEDLYDAVQNGEVLAVRRFYRKKLFIKSTHYFKTTGTLEWNGGYGLRFQHLSFESDIYSCHVHETWK